MIKGNPQAPNAWLGQHGALSQRIRASWLTSFCIPTVEVSKGILKRGNQFNGIFTMLQECIFKVAHGNVYLLHHHPSISLCNWNQSTGPGIIDKIATGPFWRHLESSSLSILEMSDTDSKMKNKFEEWSKEPQVVMDNEDLLFPCINNNDDSVLKVFFHSVPDADAMTQEVLQLLFQSFAIALQIFVIDHLPGGMYNSVIDPQV